jgi:hypothetical protein
VGGAPLYFSADGCKDWNVTSIYVNYPNPHFSLRVGVSVADRAHQDKRGQRVVAISPTTFSAEIARFVDMEVAFASKAELNDLWLELDFGDVEFEQRLGEYIQRLLGKRYEPLLNAEWREG